MVQIISDPIVIQTILHNFVQSLTKFQSNLIGEAIHPTIEKIHENVKELKENIEKGWLELLNDCTLIASTMLLINNPNNLIGVPDSALDGLCIRLTKLVSKYGGTCGEKEEAFRVIKTQYKEKSIYEEELTNIFNNIVNSTSGKVQKVLKHLFFCVRNVWL